MEYINKALGNNNDTAGQPEGTVNATEQTGNEGGGGFMGALSDKFNTMAGGGKASEANEDYLDKAIDMYQEKVLGQGPQDNESAAEQAKDEAMSDAIRSAYKSSTGQEFFVADKEH